MINKNDITLRVEKMIQNGPTRKDVEHAHNSSYQKIKYCGLKVIDLSR